MDFQEKVKRLQEQLVKTRDEKNTVESQVVFRKEWIFKLESRLQKAEEGDSDSYAWRSAFEQDIDGKLWRMTQELKKEYNALATLQKAYSELKKNAELLEGKLKREQSTEFDFGFRKKDAKEGKGEARGLGASELRALQIIADTKKGAAVTQISRRLNINYDYARLLWMSLAKHDFIDIKPDGRTELNEKGEKILEKKGLAPWL